MQDAALTLVVKNDSSENPSVLLVKRKDVPVWVLPGGGIEPSEAPEHAAVRETFEETGLTVEIVRHVATYHPVNRLAAPIYLYFCRPVGSTESIVFNENDEVLEAAFFSTKNLPSTLFPVHRSFIEEWLNAKNFPILRPLTEVTYFSILKLAFVHPILISKYFFHKFKRKFPTTKGR